MIILGGLVGILGTYLIVGFALSVLVYAGLCNEWRFVVRYDPDEKRMTLEEIKYYSDITFWLWPLMLILLAYAYIKYTRDFLGRKLSK
jgi:uncharacterized membrane protein